MNRNQSDIWKERIEEEVEKTVLAFMWFIKREKVSRIYCAGKHNLSKGKSLFAPL